MENLFCLLSVCSSTNSLLAKHLKSAFRFNFSSFGNCRSAWVRFSNLCDRKKLRLADYNSISSLNISASLKILWILTCFQYICPLTELMLSHLLKETIKQRFPLAQERRISSCKVCLSTGISASRE